MGGHPKLLIFLTRIAIINFLNPKLLTIEGVTVADGAFDNRGEGLCDRIIWQANYLASPSTCIDLMWRDSFGDVPRYPRADGSERAEHRFGQVEQKAATRSLLEHCNLWTRSLALSTLNAQGKCPIARSKHGYQHTLDEWNSSHLHHQHTGYTQ